MRDEHGHKYDVLHKHIYQGRYIFWCGLKGSHKRHSDSFWRWKLRRPRLTHGAWVFVPPLSQSLLFLSPVFVFNIFNPKEKPNKNQRKWAFWVVMRKLKSRAHVMIISSCNASCGTEKIKKVVTLPSFWQCVWKFSESFLTFNIPDSVLPELKSLAVGPGGALSMTRQSGAVFFRTVHR